MKVVIKNVTKRFTVKGTPAVFDANFTIPSGKVTTLLGPSGSGKTTLLRIISGLESADEGRVLVDDEDITRVPVGKRRFGFVFQTFALFSHLTVKENIAFGLEAQGVRGEPVRTRVKELLELVQLDGLGDRTPDQLSGGQRQRVGFARALAPYPKVLLLDEPFGALDARVRTELRAWLRELHEATHLTTILVTHDQEEALELSDQIVVMDKGRVHQVGTPREIYDNPQTSFVASFVGTANVFQAKVKDGRAAMGGLSVAMREAAPEGASVAAIVRPHDVRLSAVDGNDVIDGIEPSAHRALGRVRRMARLGSYVKLDLEIPSGEVVTVHMPRREFEAMRLEVGDAALVDLENARIFVEDFAI
ncbi:MAG TPA: ABC transporter ATP-binding protein [Polyangia bacterium]